MNGISVLRSQQLDFIQRLASSSSVLHCQVEGKHSELTVISGERLKVLRNFCWEMAEKYKQVSPVRDVFIKYLQGKLAEEVVQERLSDLITSVDYEKRLGGDGKTDFTLKFDAKIGIQVKSRRGKFNQVQWSVSAEEVANNYVIICVFVQEEINESQREYHLYLAGFLPTQMIKLNRGKINFGIEQLLYAGGLRCYLEQFHSQSLGNFSPSHSLTQNSIPSLKLAAIQAYQNQDFSRAIATYTDILEIQQQDANIYYHRGLAYLAVAEYEKAILDFLHSLNLNPHAPQVYNQMGIARYHLSDYSGAIADFSQAIILSPDHISFWKNRGDTYYLIGDNQRAIEDYGQVLQLESKQSWIDYTTLPEITLFPALSEIEYCDIQQYLNRGISRVELGYFTGAISDFNKVILENQDNKEAYYLRGNCYLEITELEMAIADYNQAIELGYKTREIYQQRSQCFYELNHLENAMADLKVAQELSTLEGNITARQNIQEMIDDLQLEMSLDELNI
ncbi:tetratricopeptide repeat protein [Calothrix sp. 336/3]|uniref:tetratricopeptide repeat protein n=1 Tax=Calothrix sp. 336/3 TaxID=1337936 RepID=UPI0004E385C0|nr:tetratricopeptide repeat protein [Calothrix sp. 336/3]AKG24329.1 hypothetical protein IJ00_26105 [Calothrix sp. 336/3]